jgi:hypothetical protein
MQTSGHDRSLQPLADKANSRAPVCPGAPQEKKKQLKENCFNCFLFENLII